MTRLRLLAAAGVVAVLVSACGPPPRPALPTGSGTPFPGFAAAYDQATEDCRAVTTITAELALSGRAAGTKLRGRINAGFAAPDDIVLEGLAPFGKPVFVLVGRGGQATLWLPRDERVLRGAPPAAIVEALAGVALTPSELRAAVAGCGLGVAAPTNGRMLEGDWAAVDSSAGTVYLRRVDGRWRVGCRRPRQPHDPVRVTSRTGAPAPSTCAHRSRTSRCGCLRWRSMCRSIRGHSRWRLRATRSRCRSRSCAAPGPWETQIASSSFNRRSGDQETFCLSLELLLTS